MSDVTRCWWCGDDELYCQYHDTEWGVPVHDDQLLFEFLILEGMQAGLSWITILRKREAFRQAFDQFDAQKVARYGDAKRAKLLQNAGIIRNRQKINASIKNAQAFLAIQETHDSFDHYIWSFVDGRPIVNAVSKAEDIPAQTPLSQTISKDLKQRGFSFVGPTIVYAHMQATGMVNDHLISCFRYKELAAK